MPCNYFPAGTGGSYFRPQRSVGVHHPDSRGHAKHGSPSPQLEGPVISPTGKGPLHIPNRKGASPHPQPKRGRSISATGKGLVHIPKWKGAARYPQPERGCLISPARKGPVHIPNQKGASPYPQRKEPAHIPNRRAAIVGDWLHSPCCMGVPNASKRGTITPVADKRVDWLHKPTV